MRKYLLVAAILLGLIPAVGMPAARAEGPPDAHEIAGILMCQCSCGLTVHNCQGAMSCSVSDGMVKQIQDQVDAGRGRQEVLDQLAATYGPGVLALPAKKGFSLAAWTTPFAAIAAGAVAIGALVWFWTRRRSGPGAVETPTMPPALLTAYEKRVDDELRLID